MNRVLNEWEKWPISPWKSEERILQKRFEHEIIDLSQVEEIEECVFSHCTFRGESHLVFMDVIFDTCDLREANYGGSSLIRVLWKGCNLVGMELDRAILKEVTVKESKAMYFNLSGSKLEFVQFSDTDLSHAGLGMLKWRALTFEQCCLDESEWLGTKLKNLDVSSCSIERLFVEPTDLVGLIIDASQSLSLIAYFGIKIKE